MCLTFDYAEAVKSLTLDVERTAAEAFAGGEAALKAAHDDANCDNIQITMLDHLDGSRSVVCYMPLSSESAVMAMYPVPSECIGEKAQYLKPCKEAPCNVANLKAILEPGELIKDVPQAIEQPIYRGLGPSADASIAAGQPSIPELPKSECIKNLDGSATFVLRTANFAKTDAEIEAGVASGEYPNRAAYLLALGKACFKSLVESMDASGVDKSKIFATTEDDPNEVEPDAMLSFLDQLYPNLMPGRDMLVCVPGVGEDGKLKMNAAFSFVFHYPEPRAAQPALGLVHNIDHSMLGSEQEVESNYFVTSNAPLPLSVPNPETGLGASVKLFGSDAFLPYDAVPAKIRSILDDEFYLEQLSRRKDLYFPDGVMLDYKAWLMACESLQAKARDKYWESMAKLCADIGLPKFDADEIFLTNLVGRRFSKTAAAFECGRDPRENTSASMLRRMKRKRELPMDMA